MVTGEGAPGCGSATSLRVAPVAGLYAELKALLGESCIGVRLRPAARRDEDGGTPWP